MGMPIGLENGVTALDSRDNMFYHGEYDETWRANAISHRDSGVMAESNREATLKRMRAIDPDERDHALISMGHWAVGSVDYLLVKIGSDCETELDDIARELRDYPVLDSDDYEARTHAEVIRTIRDCALSMQDERRNWVRVDLDESQAEEVLGLYYQDPVGQDEAINEEWWPTESVLLGVCKRLGYVEPEEGEEIEPPPCYPPANQMAFEGL